MKLSIEAGESLKMLKDWVKPDTQIYTILRHVSRSGMSRQISFVMFQDNQPLYLNYHIGRLFGLKYGKHDGLIIGGCGMDMGYHIVHNLSVELFSRDGEYDHDAAYTLKENRWL